MALVAAVPGSGPETRNACGRDGRPALGSAVQAGSQQQATASDRRPRLGRCRKQFSMFSATASHLLD
ncbi:MAG: hypothetical protein C4337_00325, partial [Armatimonadota bacterium]